MNDEFYGEISGKLDLKSPPVDQLQNAVVLSDITHGAHQGTRAPGIGIKYVARGTEYYTIDGRTYAVEEGQFMCMSQMLPSVVEVKRTGMSTLGICIFIRDNTARPNHDEALERPLISPVHCSSLGKIICQSMKGMLLPAAKRRTLASSLLSGINANLDPFLEDTARQLDSLISLKKTTRSENLRKLSVARGYLHEVTERAVELPELSVVAGLSRFQLLRYFRDCYGAPPGAYHRRLRLGLAKQAIDLTKLSCSQAAQRYGFADASSFSHAYRRAFGEPPVRNRAVAPTSR